ncbi:paraquat-inducible protein A [Neisseria polysaccharea]|uniref:paraquat-inducible protein A n=1 Tax=Neisseria polysaccharea TaxID=489 RepID=UPI000D2FC47D
MPEKIIDFLMFLDERLPFVKNRWGTLLMSLPFTLLLLITDDKTIHMLLSETSWGIWTVCFVLAIMWFDCRTDRRLRFLPYICIAKIAVSFL